MYKLKLTVKNQTEKIAISDIPALRQAFVGASLLIVIGVALAIGGSDGWLILPLLVSVGLMFSALSGWCPMAQLMEKMPWNNK
jgi:Protein of unknown function (DUF2892)